MILDTNILIYASGTDHPQRDPCRRLLHEISEQTLEATTTVLVLQEVAWVAARRHGAHHAANLVRAYMELLSPVLAVTPADLLVALDLVQSASLRPSDALIAANALRAGVPLVTVDKDFARVPDLTVMDPTAALARA